MNRSFCSLTFWRRDSFEVFTFLKHFARERENERIIMWQVQRFKLPVRKLLWKKERKKRSFAGPFSGNFNLANNKEDRVKESPELIKTHCL